MKETSYGNISVDNVFHCIYGVRGTCKEREGDKKTPIGKYKIVYEGKRANDNRFGGWSLGIDYPNYCDRQSGRTGSLISIHGGANRGTWGCMRVLDSRYQSGVSYKNIAYIANKVSKGSYVVVVENISSDLVGKRYTKLDRKAAEYWRTNILNVAKLGRSQVRCRLQNYKNDRATPICSGGCSGGVTVPSLSVSVSSVLEDRSRYGKHNLRDYKTSTVWVSKQEDKDSWVMFRYRNKKYISQMKINIGYDKKHSSYGDLWYANARPSKVMLEFSDGSYRTFTLTDTKKQQVFKFSSKYTQFVKLTVLKYRGGTYFPNDVCISELWFK
jgi:L,D-peptidoglycan transpeptidase YkuD (ErfK/YbiS/YcfS/YnhG family)